MGERESCVPSSEETKQEGLKKGKEDVFSFCVCVIFLPFLINSPLGGY